MKRNLLLSILALVPASLLSLTASCQIVLDKPPAAERTEKVYKNEVSAGYAYTSLNQVLQSRYGLQGVNASYGRDFGKYFGVMGEGSYYFKAVASGKLLMTATEQSIKGGVRINLDLLNAQQQLYTSQRDLAQARYGYLLGMLRLRAAAGTLDGESVREVGAYFR